MWEIVTTGQSGATVSRRDGVYRKTSNDPRDDLPGEAARLTWLRAHGIPAAQVLSSAPGLLETAEVPGLPASDYRHGVVDALADFTRVLHALPIADCPFDRRLAVTIPAALAADVDLDDLDDERAGWTRDELVAQLHATRPVQEDLVVCHGDLCLPNVVLDREGSQVTGLIDVGRLGVADRWTDLALMTRSLSDPGLNPGYGPWAADRFLTRYGIAPDPAKNDFYRLLDEFF
ncbi:APH(3') family aminoglycoside O-phosphotransferase [Actinoplanes friuliensis]|uniref:Aminoglycoside phosphotransferase n=1 Tax=Actinoplanes friuliensis DSM 7358 TaxID=1246995 RepID=U5W890_9ACTN|nr:APH(3') family aminoglycoside O-phosphotransferase [Actinoplanes friuliensis]AGZ44190.1 aminoglycoside phosphotransferase [Actinoplanes friuliensis DSM 7358]